MITAVDTSVVLDVFTDDPQFRDASKAALLEAAEHGGIVACEIVWAEIAAKFATDEAFEAAVALLGLRFEAADAETARFAGKLWRQYRAHGGRRARIVSDFLVGAHAQLKADRLLTRDRGFYRAYFRKLSILAPSQR